MILSISEKISDTGPVPNIQHGWSQRVRHWAQVKSQSIHDGLSIIANHISIYWYTRANDFSYESPVQTSLTICPPTSMLTLLFPHSLFRKVHLYHLFDTGNQRFEVQNVSTLSLKQQWGRLSLPAKCMNLLVTALCISPIAFGIFHGLVLQGITISVITTIVTIFCDCILYPLSRDFHVDHENIVKKMREYQTLQKMRPPTATTHQPESAPLVSILDTRKIIHQYLTTSDLLRLSVINKETYLDFRNTALIPVQRVDSESHKREKYVKMSSVLERVSMARCNIFEEFSSDIRRAYGDETLFKMTRTPNVFPLITVYQSITNAQTEKLKRYPPTLYNLRYSISLFIDSHPILFGEQAISIREPTISLNLPERVVNVNLSNIVRFNLLRSPQLTSEENPPFFPSDTPLHAFLSGRVCQLRLKNPISISYDSEARRMRRLVSIPIAIGRKTQEEMSEYVRITPTETEILIDTNPTKNLPVLSEAG